MPKERTARLNSLLKEVLSEVIIRDVRDPRVAALLTVTGVEISKDLHHAKVLISIIGTPKEKEDTIATLQSAAGFIAVLASKKVVMRYFPELTFKLDSSVDQQIRIDNLLKEIQDEKSRRGDTPSL